MSQVEASRWRSERALLASCSTLLRGSSERLRVEPGAWHSRGLSWSTSGWHSASKAGCLEVTMHQERWLPFQPDECPEAVWGQVPESEQQRVVELYALLMARAASSGPGTVATGLSTPTGGEEASDDHRQR